ncbi:hypothetical protein JMA_39050 (plasmid) [Jeotgalibacillus malaysiensis]|uniref:Uncharacterized protein n=1 Tax=Jeotgalibacillus malaysiensis TaxID=1508404 RepID=A0A0B5AXC5_9BACL|nr:hypothetical protein [Jeotgalibacillus malaysiensis]AJD93223.1 hypothetical protein JMA_39050 [Jeotgalibacillus malaysiensis]
MEVVLIILMLSISLHLLNGIFRTSINRKSHHSDEEVKENEKEKYVEQAVKWHTLLKELGEHSDLDELVRIAEESHVSDDEIPYRVLLTKEEFHVVLKQTLKERYENLELDGYEGEFTIDNLTVAVHVKRLAAYILDLQTSLLMLEEKEQAFGLSPEGTAKKNQIKQDIVESEEEIGKYAYLKSLGKKNDIISEQLSFRQFVAVEEEELLEMVDSKIGNGKPVFKNKVDTVNTPTSPALVELNKFMSENKLPDTIYNEIQDTIVDIQKKLRDQDKEKEYDKLLTEAKILEQTARKYHQIK